MRVIKGHRIIEDNWQYIGQIGNDQPLPEGDIIVPFEYWLANREVLIKGNTGLGVSIDGEVETEEVARDQDHFAIIALEFPKFTDGRCYTHARLLRDRYGFKGELRAVGDVLRDQLYFMQRCGVDSFELRRDKDIEDALNAFSEITVRYQAAVDCKEPAYKSR